VGATFAALSFLVGQVRLTVAVIILQVVILAGAYLYVRRQTAAIPAPEAEARRPYARYLVFASVVVVLLVSVVVYLGYTAQPGWAGTKEGSERP
jgi:hypothetical protein